MLPTKVVIIGAGSASFGLTTLATIFNSKRLRGSHIALVDINAEHLDNVGQLAERFNQEWDSQMTISTHSHHTQALDGAGFVINSIEAPPREELWRSDVELPAKYGVHNPHGENGGPGGFVHAARNIGPLLQIMTEMEKQCPNAWFINYTNPMTWICDLVNRYSSIPVVGLCHQYHVGYQLVGLMLANYLGFENWEPFSDTNESPTSWEPRLNMRKRTKPRVHIKSAGINHFSWMLEVYDKQTGEDLYPRFAEQWAKHDPDFEPITRRIYDSFGIFPTPGDAHMCEYLPWVTDPITKPWEKYHLHYPEWDLAIELRKEGHKEIRAMADNISPIDELENAESDGALEVVENIAGGGVYYHLAVNLPNRGYISNLPDDAIVEVPAVTIGAGVEGIHVGPLPEGVAELCRRQLTCVRLGVDAAVHGDRQLALQCLLLDPVITDFEVAKMVLDDYLETYREYLPQFWN